MIKFDRDVHGALKELEKAGFETYAAGDCVRDVIRGEKVYDWDLVSTASAEEMKKLFPKGEILKGDSALGEDEPFLRVDYTYEIPPKDEDDEAVIEGVILDIHHFDGSVEELISTRGFTIDAMADNPERGFVDPYEGREDIRKKLIRTIGSAGQLFEKEPIRMMEAVRLAAEMGFDLHKEVYDAIVANWRLLLEGDIAPVREELEKLLVSDHAGKGLSMLAESGLMAVVFGEEIASKMSMTDMNAFRTVCENIDKTRPVRTRRLGLLFTCLAKKKGLAAIERMEFDPETKMHLDDAMNEIITIQFLNDDYAFKRYLYEHGMDRYEYLHNLAKAMRIVY
ncbi:MAG: hypothetical protein ACI4LA_08360, partial [Emergencia sp.]